MIKIFLGIILFVSSIFANSPMCTITMGYKEKIKEPFIFKDNSGLYKDLYSKAAYMIGCKLDIKREPKKRVIAKIKKGMIDFYPGFSITEKRVKFTYYIKNGLSKSSIGITRDDSKNIVDLDEVKKIDLIVLNEKGGANKLKKYNFKTLNILDLSIKKSLTLIKSKRADFYMGDRSNVEYYFKKYKPKGLKLHTIKGKENVWYLGFARNSKHTISLLNPYYDKTKKLSFKNYPIVLDKTCVAYRFQKALLKLKNDGYTDKLYNKYFK